mmetsp:Transcript_53418/g.171134  ORF Transcript_53418/g.171134 Transcript_53418/m.171134 type:complete len:326 (-) Transcript_53418:4-981(-)
MVAELHSAALHHLFAHERAVQGAVFQLVAAAACLRPHDELLPGDTEVGELHRSALPPAHRDRRSAEHDVGRRGRIGGREQRSRHWRRTITAAVGSLAGIRLWLERLCGRAHKGAPHSHRGDNRRWHHAGGFGNCGRRGGDRGHALPRGSKAGGSGRGRHSGGRALPRGGRDRGGGRGRVGGGGGHAVPSSGRGWAGGCGHLDGRNGRGRALPTSSTSAAWAVVEELEEGVVTHSEAALLGSRPGRLVASSRRSCGSSRRGRCGGDRGGALLRCTGSGTCGVACRVATHVGHRALLHAPHLQRRPIVVEVVHPSRFPSAPARSARS